MRAQIGRGLDGWGEIRCNRCLVAGFKGPSLNVVVFTAKLRGWDTEEDHCPGCRRLSGAEFEAMQDTHAWQERLKEFARKYTIDAEEWLGYPATQCECEECQTRRAAEG